MAETDLAVTVAAEALAVHRWKSMGVASVECECGAILYGDESLAQFPADEAFRCHLAGAVLEAIRAVPKADMDLTLAHDVRADELVRAAERNRIRQQLEAIASEWEATAAYMPHIDRGYAADTLRRLLGDGS